MSQRLFQQVANWLANQAATEALSNSRWFQRFAVRTHYMVRDAQKKADALRADVAASPEVKAAADKLRAAQGASAGAGQRRRLAEKQNSSSLWDQLQVEWKRAQRDVKDGLK